MIGWYAVVFGAAFVPHLAVVLARRRAERTARYVERGGDHDRRQRSAPRTQQVEGEKPRRSPTRLEQSANDQANDTAKQESK